MSNQPPTVREQVDSIWFNAEDGMRKRQQLVDLITELSPEETTN